MAAPIGGAGSGLQQSSWHRRLRARKAPPIRPPIQGGPVAVLQSPTQVTGVKMKLIAWAIALAAAGLTPAAAQARRSRSRLQAGRRRPLRPSARRAEPRCCECAAPHAGDRQSAAATSDRDRRRATPSPKSISAFRSGRHRHPGAGDGDRPRRRRLPQHLAARPLRRHQPLRSRPARLDDGHVSAAAPTRRRRARRTTPRSKSSGRWSRC